MSVDMLITAIILSPSLLKRATFPSFLVIQLLYFLISSRSIFSPSMLMISFILLSLSPYPARAILALTIAIRVSLFTMNSSLVIYYSFILEGLGIASSPLRKWRIYNPFEPLPAILMLEIVS